VTRSSAPRWCGSGGLDLERYSKGAYAAEQLEAEQVTPAMRASRTANDIVPHPICWPRHWNVWSSSGASMPCSLTISPATTMVSPSMILAVR
jgi:hypothetical protein